MQRISLKQILVPLTLLVMIMAAGCNIPTPPPAEPTGQPQAQPTQTQQPAEPQPGGEEQAPAAEGQTPSVEDPLAACPREEAGKSLYVNQANGTCFLYPSTFTLQRDELRPDDTAKLLGPTESDKEKSMERATVVLWVASNGPADIADGPAYAQKWLQVNAMNLSPGEIQPIPLTIGGQAAAALPVQMGQIPQQTGFVVANGYKYTLTIMPQPGLLPELDPAVQEAWDMVTSSIVFFPPSVSREVQLAADFCPQPVNGEKLYVSEVDGYCYLYSPDFAPIPDFAGRIQGGPNLGSWQGFENVQPALTVGSYPLLGDEAAKTARDMLAPRTGIDPATLQDRTIGGALAVTFIDRPDGSPWASQQALIVNNGRMYTILSDPWEPERWPEAMPYLESNWDTVLNSFTLFTPWN